MVNDPISDLIIRLKNAGAVKQGSVSIPHSAFKHAIAEKLKEVGYIKSVEKKGKKTRKTLDITLTYNESGAHIINGVKRVSKPARRVYKRANEIIPVHYGHGTLILSTPKGIMTDKEARKGSVGGEALFEIW